MSASAPCIQSLKSLQTPLAIALLYSPPAGSSGAGPRIAAAAALEGDAAESIIRRAPLPAALPPASAAFLETLARSPDAQLRAAAAAYPGLSLTALKALAADRAWAVREAAARGGALFAQAEKSLPRGEALALLLALPAGDASLAAAALTGGILALRDPDAAPEEATGRQRLLLDFIAALAQTPLFADPDLEEAAASALYAAANVRAAIRRPLSRRRWRRGAEDPKLVGTLEALASGEAPFGDVEPEERKVLRRVLERCGTDEPPQDSAEAGGFFLCFATQIPEADETTKEGDGKCADGIAEKNAEADASHDALRAAIGLPPGFPVERLDPALGLNLILLPSLGRWPLSADEAAAAADSLPFEGTDRLVEALAAHPAERVREAVASRWALPKGAVEHLRHDRSQRVREAIAGNAAFLDELDGGEILAVLGDDPDLIERAADLCGSDRIARLLAKAYSEDPDPRVRAAVRALAEDEAAEDGPQRSAMRRRFGRRRQPMTV